MGKNNKGFTLVEILLAIMIGSLVLTSVYGIFSSVSSARNRLGAEGEVYHQARIFFDRLGSELSSMRFAPLDSRPVFASGKDSDGNVYFEFNTELVSPLLQQHGGLSRVRYEVEADEDDEVGETLVLSRSEEVLLANLAAAEPLEFIAGLKTFELRYFSQGSWRDSWSSSAPPEMVEVLLEQVVGEQSIPFRTSFILPKAR